MVHGVICIIKRTFVRNVAAGFSLRFPSSDEFMTISCKLRNLKVTATCPTLSFGRAQIAQIRFNYIVLDVLSCFNVRMRSPKGETRRSISSFVPCRGTTADTHNAFPSSVVLVLRSSPTTERGLLSQRRRMDGNRTLYT